LQDLVSSKRGKQIPRLLHMLTLKLSQRQVLRPRPMLITAIMDMADMVMELLIIPMGMPTVMFAILHMDMDMVLVMHMV